jgi:hypothetical protein
MCNSSTEQYYKNLGIEVEKLHKLLQDPHPGLITWCEMVNNRLRAIDELTN